MNKTLAKLLQTALACSALALPALASAQEVRASLSEIEVPCAGGVFRPPQCGVFRSTSTSDCSDDGQCSGEAACVRVWSANASTYTNRCVAPARPRLAQYLNGLSAQPEKGSGHKLEVGAGEVFFYVPLLGPLNRFEGQDYMMIDLACPTSTTMALDIANWNYGFRSEAIIIGDDSNGNAVRRLTVPAEAHSGPTRLEFTCTGSARQILALRYFEHSGTGPRMNMNRITVRMNEISQAPILDPSFDPWKQN